MNDALKSYLQILPERVAHGARTLVRPARVEQPQLRDGREALQGGEAAQRPQGVTWSTSECISVQNSYFFYRVILVVSE